MPGFAGSPEFRPRKRKRNDDVSSVRPESSTTSVHLPPRLDNMKLAVDILEDQILQSRQYYNNITTLINYASESKKDSEKSHQARLALCRIFSRLMAGGEMVALHKAVASETVILEWLKKRYQHYCRLILSLLTNGTRDEQNICLTVVMQLCREEISGSKLDEKSTWKIGLFPKFVQTLTNQELGDEIRHRFVQEYVDRYADIRLYTFQEFARITATRNDEVRLDGVISIMAALKYSESSGPRSDAFFVDQSKRKLSSYAATAQKRAAQDVWMTIFQRDLTVIQRKVLLRVMSHRIVPWLLKPELLMDFLTDSFNVGSPISLMALSGLFYLIQKMNLDYPQFYQKLYSLLDSYVLHSKHRSRFFRLLEIVLASTHLPSILVASFIKRLSRLCLYAPPSGIVVAVPWIYNLLKNHPTCTFMIHRELKGSERKAELEKVELHDQFRMDEDDPMLTGAIESSLWEIECLHSHFHPNVAAIARIISEQFTKQGYNVEDFLDHTYGSMLDSELAKTMKKTPVVEYEIPKRIFTNSVEQHSRPEYLVSQLWDFDG